MFYGLFHRFSAGSAVKNDPGAEIRAKIEKTVFNARSDENQIARRERVLIGTMLEHACTADDDINFIL